MTRRHFEAIAKAIRESQAKELDKKIIARELAMVFAEMNPRFDFSRFFEACSKP